MTQLKARVLQHAYLEQVFPFLLSWTIHGEHSQKLVSHFEEYYVKAAPLCNSAFTDVELERVGRHVNCSLCSVPDDIEDVLFRCTKYSSVPKRSACKATKFWLPRSPEKRKNIKFIQVQSSG